MTKRESHKTARVIWENRIKPVIKSEGKNHIFTSRNIPELETYAPRDRGAIMDRMEKDGILQKLKPFYGDHEIREYKISESLVSLSVSQIDSLDYRDAIKKCLHRNYV